MVINSEDLPFVLDEGRRSRMSRSIALALKMDVNLQFKQYEQAKAAANRHNLQASCGSSFFLLHINTSDAIVAIGGFFYSRIEKEIPV